MKIGWHLLSTELYFGQPPGGPAALFYRSVAALTPDGRRLFALDTGIVASLYVFDVSTDAPVYLGEDCCHGCIGNNGRQVTISPFARPARYWRPKAAMIWPATVVLKS